MRLIATSLAALALLSTPAFAQSTPTALGGGDGISGLVLGATAGNYCQLGQVNSTNVQATNATATTPTGNTSDVNLAINLQDVNDNIAPWSANITIPNSVCNHAYSLTVQSTYGGLHYVGSENGPTNFSTNVPYTVQATFGTGVSVNQSSTALQSRGVSSSNASAYAGSATIVLTGAQDTTKYLLQGSYSDVGVVTIGPRVS
ncbi:hypothetical protein [Novosphingobium rosa]|uniref:hypothetical protein n=1 Tax=Novosphingobium rosa TaxID=76978 RepID=UPI000832325A|nr:hypothetical protein [Novosphingobium rosa]